MMDPVNELYRDVILDHYRHPRGAKPLAAADVRNEGYNPLCGDQVELSLAFRDGRVAGVALQGRGCSISVASGSMMAELLEGKSPEQVLALADALRALMHGKPAPEGLDMGELEALEGVRKFPVRVKCALLPWETLRDALAAWREGRPSPPRPSSMEE